MKLGRLILFLLIMSSLGLVLDQIGDTLFNPWAHSLLNSQKLTGAWLGQLRDKPPKVGFLTLYRPRASEGEYARCNLCPDVEGWFRLCGATGVSAPYRVSGKVRSWRGSDLTLWFNTGLGPDPLSNQMSGTWDQGDTLRLNLNTQRNSGTPNISSSDVAIDFHHALESAFADSCAQLKPH